MYGVTSYPGCPDANKYQRKLTDAKQRRANAKYQWRKNRLTEEIQRHRRKRDNALLKCQQEADTAVFEDPYMTGQGESAGGTLGYDSGTVESGMGAAQPLDYGKVLLGTAILGGLVWGAMQVLDR